MSQKNLEGGWSGFGMATVGIHPNDFWVLNGHPNKIPTNEMLGDVVNNCRRGLQVSRTGTLTVMKVLIKQASLILNGGTFQIHFPASGFLGLSGK